MLKVKISRNVGLNVAKPESKVGDYNNIFYNIDQRGTEVSLDEKKLAYIKDSQKRFLKAQKILEEAWLKGE